MKNSYTQNNNLLLPVLIINNHVLSKNGLENDIKIKVNGETKIISIKGRYNWTNEKIDFTCIEKNEEDNIQTFFNLDFDDNVLDKNYSNDNYLEQKVIIFSIDKTDNKQMGLSNGVIKKIKNQFFIYLQYI